MAKSRQTIEKCVATLNHKEARCKKFPTAGHQSVVGDTSTAHAGFSTTKTDRYKTQPDKCHVDWVILDSGWEADVAAKIEARFDAMIDGVATETV